MSPEMGFSVDILMELAGLSCAQAIQASYPVCQFPKVLLIIGPGNNGGDGLVCARHLFHFGYKVQCFYPKQRDAHPFVGLKKQCSWLNIPIVTELDAIHLDSFDLIVDAIFGYSFKGEIRAPFDQVIKALVSTHVPIVSIDIPSGWDVDKGDPDGVGIKPDCLISLTAPKLGARSFEGCYHYLGGRFVPPSMQAEYGLDKLPPYPGSSQFVLLSQQFLPQWTGPYGGLPPFGKAQPKHLKPALEHALKDADARIQHLAHCHEEPTFKNTIEAFETSTLDLNRVTTIYNIFTHLLSDDQIQAIETEFEPKISEFSDRIYQNSALFHRIKKIYDARDHLNLSEEQKRLLWVRHQEFISRGALVKDEDKPRLTAINSQLASLFTQFGHNLLADENQFVELKESELDGLPTDVIDAAKAAAVEAGAPPGAYHIVNTRSSVEPFLTSSKRRDLRQVVFQKFVSRGNNKDKNDNNEIVANILKLRAERAQLLGYKTHAHWRTDDTMAKTPEAACKLMEDVWKPAVATVHQEVAEMQKIADAEGQGVTIEPWDYRYYAEKVRVAQYDLDMDLVKPYFQLDKLKEAVFWVAEQLFHIWFHKIDVPVYHPDVEAYEVKDKHENHVGIWYFDPYAKRARSLAHG